MARASIAELVNSSLSVGLKGLSQKIKLRAMLEDTQCGPLASMCILTYVQMHLYTHVQTDV